MESLSELLSVASFRLIYLPTEAPIAARTCDRYGPYHASTV